MCGWVGGGVAGGVCFVLEFFFFFFVLFVFVCCFLLLLLLFLFFSFCSMHLRSAVSTVYCCYFALLPCLTVEKSVRYPLFGRNKSSYLLTYSLCCFIIFTVGCCLLGCIEQC